MPYTLLCFPVSMPFLYWSRLTSVQNDGRKDVHALISRPAACPMYRNPRCLKYKIRDTPQFSSATGSDAEQNLRYQVSNQQSEEDTSCHGVVLISLLSRFHSLTLHVLKATKGNFFSPTSPLPSFCQFLLLYTLVVHAFHSERFLGQFLIVIKK